ncbi:MAG: 16S rRNA (adenine(1518)-N(6)/adenine(1519)-N(6))-dimethyltransferase RsmA [Alphaproteobacteria bacterium]|nr:16S rRNA (adenine(1518)-N(6)/adenine(1519)-N(6))-dimethyltransferase RsmA [Alphaproteobacteria bacterium]
MKNTNHESRITNHELAALPPISEMMRTAGLEPKKQFGQNFLFDLNLTDKIARSVPDIQNQTVIEVGPGPGGLTRSLLATGAKKVISIEYDKTTKPILDEIIAVSDGRLEVVYEDALKISDFGFLISDLVPQVSICSNLPYNIGTELLVRWLHLISQSSILNPQSSMTLMFQREVAERIVARVGDKQYGRLSVLVALTCDAKILFNVPATAFYPKPKVQSAVVQLIPKQIENRKFKIENLEQLTARLFGQRRKMIRSIMPGVDWTQFGLTGTERAEELSPMKFLEIAKEIKL